MGEVLVPDSGFYANLKLPTIAYIKLGFIFSGDKKEIKEPAVFPALNAGTIFEIVPNNLISFNFRRTINGIGDFKIVVWDRFWTKIEEAIVRSNGRIFFQYGYKEGFEGAENLVSYPTGGRIFNYAIDFRLNGTILTLTGIADGYVTSVVKKYAAFGSENKKISDIVKDIIKQINLSDTDEDFFPVVEETLPLKSTPLQCEDFEKAEKTFFANNGDPSLTFIATQLAGYAVSAENGSGYVTYVTRNAAQGGRKEFHFHTPRYKQVNDDVFLGGEPVFSMFRYAQTPIINFSPSWMMSLVQIIGGGGEWTASYDISNKNTIIGDYNDKNKNDDGKLSGPPSETGSLENKTLPPTDALGVTSAFENEAGLAGTSPDETAALLQNRTDVRKIGALSGTLKIIGNPKFNILNKIRIIVFIPIGNNVSSEGNAMVHWISGSYLISGIEENIDRSGYSTTFSLLTDGRILLEPDSKANKEDQHRVARPNEPYSKPAKVAQGPGETT